MLLYFLGTGAGRPSLNRNVSAVLLKMPAPIGELWLFDCGEGTQHQILRSPFNLNRISRVFITHLHGDHIFGLPGLLASRSFTANGRELTVYGPAGIKSYLEEVLNISVTRLSYPLHIREIAGGQEFSAAGWRIKTHSLTHAIPSFGYRLEEPDSPGSLDAERLKELGVPPGPLYGRLKAGETVTLADGRVLKGTDFIGPKRRGRHVVLLGDTRVSSALIPFVAEADLLVHEATFEQALTEQALKYHHSTTLQAAQVAKAGQVKTLVLTHFSSRYKGEDMEKLANEARAVFPNTFLAEDHFSLELARS